MIYSDGIHLIHMGGIDALHMFAASIGIKRCWFHSSAKYPHYDIPKRRRKNFFKENPEVIQVSSRVIVIKLKRYKKII